MVLGRIYNIPIDVAVFINLTYEHLDFHEYMQTYAYDKLLLFVTLGDNLSEVKFGVLNKDDSIVIIFKIVLECWKYNSYNKYIVSREDLFTSILIWRY